MIGIGVINKEEEMQKAINIIQRMKMIATVIETSGFLQKYIVTVLIGMKSERADVPLEEHDTYKQLRESVRLAIEEKELEPDEELIQDSIAKVLAIISANRIRSPFELTGPHGGELLNQALAFTEERREKNSAGK